MSKLASVLIACAAVAGCVGTGVDGETYVGVPGSRAWFDSASPATQRAYFTKRCEVYGYRAGTSDMARCLQAESMQQRRVAEARAIAAASTPIYIPDDRPNIPQVNVPWQQQQPQRIYVPNPTSTLSNAGRNAYCTRTPWNC